MSDLATGGDAGAPFAGRTVALMLAVGIVSFIGMLVLGAYAPDLRSGRNGGAHALSNAATGYAGIVRLAEATGRHPRIVRDEHDFDGEDLLVLTPEDGFVDVGKVLAHRAAKPTLIVLPKWLVAPDRARRGWVRYTGLAPRFQPEAVLAPDNPLAIARRRSGGRPLVQERGLPAALAVSAPRPLQVITGYRARRERHRDTLPALRPLLTDGRGGIVVAQIGDTTRYVLADPDLLANHGIRDPARAAAALALLDWLNSTGADGIDFDVTLNGLGHAKSPLRLAFDPPFLAMTLTIAAAALLAGLHALGRFGPVARRERALAFGKTALVDNAAALVGKARREAALGWRYAALARERAAAAFRAPPRAREAELDAWLDGLGGEPRFSALARATADAGDAGALASAARALHEWQGRVVS